MKFKVIAVYDYWVKFVIEKGPAKELKLPKKCFGPAVPEVGDVIEIRVTYSEFTSPAP